MNLDIYWKMLKESHPDKPNALPIGFFSVLNYLHILLTKLKTRIPRLLLL